MRLQSRNLWAFAPIVLVLAVCFTIGWVIAQQAKILPQQLRHAIKSDYLESKKKDLKSHIELAQKAIKHLREPGLKLTDEEAKEGAKRILTNLRYSEEDGYFFVYDFTGTNIVHPIKKGWNGQNKWDYQDSNGKYVIRDLLKTALGGDGFDEYLWHKPSADHAGRSKLAYMVVLEDWEWVLGTGVYLDDVERFLDGIDTELRSYIHDSLKWVTAITLLGVMVLSIIQIRIGRIIACTLLARELHDKVKQDLAYIARELGNKLALFNHSGVMAIAHDQDFLRNMQDAAQQALSKIIFLIEGKDPDNPSLVEGLKMVKNDSEKREGIPVIFSLSNQMKAQTDHLAKAKKMALIEVAREALNNIGKHAAATQVNMQLGVDDHNIILIIHDNGIGFDIDYAIRGMGLNNMEAYMKEVDGTLLIVSSLEEGTTITATAPRNHNIWSDILCLLNRP